MCSTRGPFVGDHLAIVWQGTGFGKHDFATQLCPADDGTNHFAMGGHERSSEGFGKSRIGLCLAASLAASGRWPADAPPVVQGVPGAPDMDRETLLRKVAQSQRIVERAARAVVGHESDPCPLVHPQIGQLRCGEWLLFAGVHDLMHLDQLHGLIAEGDR